jgi:hypothetical protein
MLVALFYAAGSSKKVIPLQLKNARWQENGNQSERYKCARATCAHQPLRISVDQPILRDVDIPTPRGDEEQKHPHVPAFSLLPQWGFVAHSMSPQVVKLKRKLELLGVFKPRPPMVTFTA